MPLLRVPDAFDHPDWLFELKHDGFRALAKIDGHQCTLVSRRRHVYRQFPQLQEEIAHAIRAHAALLDDEIVYLASDGRSVFNRLLFRRDWPHFVAFDVLSIDGEDVRARPLLERKRRLRALCLESSPGWSSWTTSPAADPTCLPRCARRTLRGIVAGSGSAAGITATDSQRPG